MKKLVFAIVLMAIGLFFVGSAISGSNIPKLQTTPIWSIDNVVFNGKCLKITWSTKSMIVGQIVTVNVRAFDNRTNHNRLWVGNYDFKMSQMKTEHKICSRIKMNPDTTTIGIKLLDKDGATLATHFE